MSRRAKDTHIDVLFEEVKAGKVKPTPTQRRRLLVYLDEVGETFTNIELAKMFGISETVIRDDKKRLLTEFGSTLTPQAQIEFLARHLQDINALVIAAERGRLALAKIGVGSINERFYIETLAKLYKERRETLENTGILRKELGTLNVTEEQWIATVSQDGLQGVHEASPDERAAQ